MQRTNGKPKAEEVQNSVEPVVLSKAAQKTVQQMFEEFNLAKGALDRFVAYLIEEYEVDGSYIIQDLGDGRMGFVPDPRQQVHRELPPQDVQE